MSLGIAAYLKLSCTFAIWCRDETLEALSDAQVVAPAAQTVDLHSADHRNSYLYVFDYQTKYGDYPQVSKFHRTLYSAEILPYHVALLLLISMTLIKYEL